MRSRQLFCGSIAPFRPILRPWPAGGRHSELSGFVGWPARERRAELLGFSYARTHVGFYLRSEARGQLRTCTPLAFIMHVREIACSSGLVAAGLEDLHGLSPGAVQAGRMSRFVEGLGRKCTGLYRWPAAAGLRAGLAATGRGGVGRAVVGLGVCSSSRARTVASIGRRVVKFTEFKPPLFGVFGAVLAVFIGRVASGAGLLFPVVCRPLPWWARSGRSS
jgi:hypothetical protein